MIELDQINKFLPPKDWIEINTVEVHAAGEPLRIIMNGFPRLNGKTILEKRAYALSNYDKFRTAMIWEPRGHTDMYGAIIVEAESSDSDFGVIFIHNDGYSTGCGHAVIALTKAFLEMNLVAMIEPETEIKMDVPSGQIVSYGKIENNTVKDIRFQNVPSFVQLLDASIDVPGYGKIKYDLAFGGAFYAFVEVDQLRLDCTNEYCDALIEAGMKIKDAISNSIELQPPTEDEMNFLYGTIFIGPPKGSNSHSRNVCIFADGEVDRSPTGTGISARAANHYERNEIELGEKIIIESIIGTTFSVKVDRALRYGKYNAIIPEINGEAYITGRNTFWLNPDDPLKDGFIIK